MFIHCCPLLYAILQRRCCRNFIYGCQKCSSVAFRGVCGFRDVTTRHLYTTGHRFGSFENKEYMIRCSHIHIRSDCLPATRQPRSAHALTMPQPLIECLHENGGACMYGCIIYQTNSFGCIRRNTEKWSLWQARPTHAMC
jgi:hypothetical protein